MTGEGKYWSFRTEEALAIEGDTLFLMLAAGACEPHSYSACWDRSFETDAATGTGTANVVVRDDAPSPDATCNSLDLADLDFEIGEIRQMWIEAGNSASLFVEVPRNDEESQTVEYAF